MDSLLSMTKGMVNQIFEQMTLIETTESLVKTLDEGTLVIQMNGDSKDFASLELLDEEQMKTIKGYINAELFANMENAKRFLERVNGITPEPEEDFVSLEELENNTTEKIDENLNSDIIKVKKAGRQTGSGKLTDDAIAKEIKAGLTAAEMAEKYNMKESSVKKYIQRFKNQGSTLQNKDSLEERKANAKAKEEATPARKRV